MKRLIRFLLSLLRRKPPKPQKAYFMGGDGMIEWRDVE